MSANSAEHHPDQAIIALIKKENPPTTEQLIALAHQRLGLPETEIVETVLRLQREGKIRLAEPPRPAPPTMAAYVKTAKATWYWATALTTVATAALVLTIPEDLYPWVYIRYVLGAVFVLWLPGYSFIRALFPISTRAARTPEGLDTVERVALSLGMSLALVPLVGLLLNYTPWGIRLTPIVLSLLALTLVFATAALIRDHQANIKALTQTPKQ